MLAVTVVQMGVLLPASAVASAPCGTGKNTSIVGGRSNITSGAVLQAQASFDKINPAMCTGSATFSASACWTMAFRGSNAWGQVGWTRQVSPVPPPGVPTTDAVLLVQVKNLAGPPLTLYGNIAQPTASVAWKTVFSLGTAWYSFYRAGTLVASVGPADHEPNQAQYACETWNAGDDIGGLSAGNSVNFRNASAQFSTGGGLNEIALTKYEDPPHVTAYKRIWYSTQNDFDDYTSR